MVGFKMVKKPVEHIEEIEAAVKNPERLAAVHQMRLLDGPPLTALDELAHEASRRLNAPLVLFTLVDEFRDFLLAQVGLPALQAQSREIVDSPSFCQLTVAEGETVIINDTLDSSLLRMFPSVHDSGVRAHLGVPLMSNGQAIGNCCVIDFYPREWTAEDIDMLTRLADAVSRQMANTQNRTELTN